VEFQRDGRLPYACRPTALRRAIRFVIENAVRYGEGARVALGSSEQGVEIVEEDDCPGIPEGGQEEGLQSLRAPRDLKKPRHWRRRPRSFDRPVHFRGMEEILLFPVKDRDCVCTCVSQP
jgi:hypothetical protein